MKRNVLPLLPILLIAIRLSAQDAGESSYPSIKMDGSLKNKYEYATETRNSRFSVRNSRIGVRGMVNSFVSYRTQVELSDNGNFKVLDLSGTLTPAEGLNLTLGQTSIPLFNTYILAPAAMMFANRTFIGKYFLSSRDIGFLAKYSIPTNSFPMSIEAGLFNGHAINNPVWKNELAYGGRIELGNMQGARVTAKVYNYPKDEEKKFLFYGTDFRYGANNWKVETEIMKRKSKTEFYNDLLSYYLQGAYNFPLRSRFFDELITALRWDGIDEATNTSGIDVQRLTTGLGLAFDRNNYSSILRFDYEWYFVNRDMSIFASNPEMDSDKFTIELLISF